MCVCVCVCVFQVMKSQSWAIQKQMCVKYAKHTYREWEVGSRETKIGARFDAGIHTNSSEWMDWNERET